MTSIKRIFLSKSPRFAAFSIWIALSCFKVYPRVLVAAQITWIRSASFSMFLLLWYSVSFPSNLASIVRRCFRLRESQLRMFSWAIRWSQEGGRKQAYWMTSASLSISLAVVEGRFSMAPCLCIFPSLWSNSCSRRRYHRFLGSFSQSNSHLYIWGILEYHAYVSYRLS